MLRIADAWDTPERYVVLKEVYADLPKISIDYAVMEPAARGAGTAKVIVVPMAVDWLDVGSWPTLARTLENDSAQNAANTVTVLVDSEGNIVVSDDPEHLVATVGLRDTIIVHTRDVTMVCPEELRRTREGPRGAGPRRARREVRLSRPVIVPAGRRVLTSRWARGSRPPGTSS